MTFPLLVVTQPSGYDCDNCGEPIEVGAEVRVNCPHCQIGHHFHAVCVSEYGIAQLGGPEAFVTLVKIVVSSQN